MTNKNTYEIYQLSIEAEMKFFGLERMERFGFSIKPEEYNKVYTGHLEPGMGLEDIYMKFNIDHPEDFRGHSLSVSDVVVLNEGEKKRAYFCDSIGFKEIPNFVERLKDAEMEQLAYDIDAFSFDYDPYEYKDCIESREEGVAEVLQSLGSGVTDHIKEFLSDIVEENQDPDYTENAKRLLDRMGKLEASQGVKKNPTLDEKIAKANSKKSELPEADVAKTKTEKER